MKILDIILILKQNNTKARVKATGEIVEVREEYDLQKEMVEVFYSHEEDPYEVYEKEELDFNVNDNIDPTIDYWTRLEHQYAGMAMQGILGNQTYTKNLLETSTSAKDVRDIIVDASCYLAHALVEKLKEKEEK